MTAATSFRNLVFEGGGVRGVAYIGCLRVLEEHRILSGIEAVAGTSAGAITATLVALGFTPKALEDLLLPLDFRTFEDGGLEGPIRVVEKFGWYRGDAFLNWMRTRVGEKLGSPDATFADLARSARPMDLRVVATDLSTHDLSICSATDTPDLSIALAVRMSMSIPLFFEAVRYQEAVYVDGGVVWGYPIEIFDQGRRARTRAEDGTDVDRSTLGFHLGVLGPAPPPRGIGNLAEYAKGLYEALMSVQSDLFQMNDEDVRRTVFIDDLGIRSTDFGITKKQKEALIKEGAKATQAYLRGSSDS